jgi:hypothetical protein
MFVDFGKSLDHLGIELSAGAPSQFGYGSVKTRAPAIDPIAYHGIEGVYDRKNTSISINFIALYIERVSFPVPSFMVLNNY